MRDEYLTLSEHELATLGTFAQSEYGRVFLMLVQRMHDAEDERMKANPRIADKVKDDLRYRMGVVAGIWAVLNVPNDINLILSKGE